MLESGNIVGGRFVIDGLIGQGGMGRVYRAADRSTGGAVALKVLLDREPSELERARFAAETRVLAELAHPGIVRYVAHGETDDGRPFLAMELLTGDSLRVRLSRSALSLADSLLVQRRAAAALAEAHRHGVVHRDLKPSNLFLRDGQLDRLAILDFGVARRLGASHVLTASGAILGSPGYMAPEQVTGASAVDAAADVFALGCVLYECLTGRSPFQAETLVAALAKIVFDEPAPLASQRAGVPPSVAALVARMLAKSPKERPRDAAALLTELDGLELSPEAGDGPSTGEGLGRGELERVTVILASHAADDVEREPLATTVDTALRAELMARGASIEVCGESSVVVTLGRLGESALDQAVEAAHCAWRLRECLRGSRITVATARRVAGAPIGEAIDRASELLRSANASNIVFDETTAQLLEGRVRTVRIEGGLSTLLAAPAELDEERLLLGRPTPFVGREQELGTLEMAMRASFDEARARAVLVVAPPGLGKSRLRHELLRTPIARGALCLAGRGEPLRAGTPYGVVGRALRRHWGVTAGDVAGAAHTRLLAGVRQFVAPDEVEAVVEMLAEICDLPLPEDHSVGLRAARQDPRLMQARVGEAFVAFMRGATQGGLVLVLEDLHWADRASIELCELALRRLEDCPLFVVAFARPEVHELVSQLWRGRVLELPLRPLALRACEHLVRSVAGARLDAVTVARVVELSAGNALHLEELIRSACDGEPGAVPQAVVAMLQARIARLPAAERRLLRAASVFGESFSAEGVSVVLGGGHHADDVARWLRALADEELVTEERLEPGRYRFRHALLREAAYGLLTEEDRPLGHRLAARWLATREHDPALVAEHYLLAGEPALAGPWLVKAAQRGLERDDYEIGGRLAQRARAAGVQGEALGALAAIEGFCAILRVDWRTARAAATEAEALLAPGSYYWCHVQRTLAQHRAYGDEHEALVAGIERFLAVAPDADARWVYADTAIFVASSSIQTGHPALGSRLLDRATQTLGEDIAQHPALHAWLEVVRSTLHRHTDDALAAQLERLEHAFRLYEAVGNTTVVQRVARSVYGEVLARAGRADQAQVLLRSLLADAVQRNFGFVISHARLALANVLVQSGAHDEAERLAQALLAVHGLTPGYQAMAREILAQTCLQRGDLAAAERQARAAVSLSPHTPVRRWRMTAHLVRALIAQGRSQEAFDSASFALRELQLAGTGGGYSELALVVASAEAARAAGSHADAQALTERAQVYCARQAAAFGDAAAATSYLASVPPLARPIARD